MLSAFIVSLLPAWTGPLPQLAHTQRRHLQMCAENTAPVLKDCLLSLLNSNDFTMQSPLSTQRQEVDELILALSALSPTAAPARSPLVNGVWEVAYTQTPGSGFFDSPTRPLALALYATGLSPGVLAQGLAKLPMAAAAIGPVQVTIASADAGQPRVESQTSLSLAGGALTNDLIIRANLAARSDICLREEFVECEALGQRLLLPGPLALARSLFVTYLDEEVLILRDDGGLVNVLAASLQPRDMQ